MSPIQAVQAIHTVLKRPMGRGSFQSLYIATGRIFSRYEIPRKLVHLLVGSFILQFYTHGVLPSKITTWNLQALFFFTAVDILRHRFPAFNAGHHSIFGCLMRQRESTQYNSLVWYLLGTYLALVLFPTDVGLVGVFILCYSDTAAATFGRLCAGRTRDLRPGKSIAGTLAAGAAGALTGFVFWGYSTDLYRPKYPDVLLMFTGRLSLCPTLAGNVSPWGVCTSGHWVISGRSAISVLSFVSGLVAAGSEFVDFFGCDDNVVIPVLSSLGVWAFLSVFGSPVDEECFRN